MSTITHQKIRISNPRKDGLRNCYILKGKGRKHIGTVENRESHGHQFDPFPPERVANRKPLDLHYERAFSLPMLALFIHRQIFEPWRAAEARRRLEEGEAISR